MSTSRLAFWIALVGGAELALQGHLGDHGRIFHGGAWLFAAMLASVAWRRRGAWRLVSGVACLVPIALSGLALAGVPARIPNPVLAFWEDRSLERRVLTTILARGPVALFGHEIPLDTRGYRVETGVPTSRDTYRIVALGGSTTFGATRGPEERSWPARLQERIAGLRCARPVAVVNAGRLGRALGGALRQLERDFGYLRPDLVVAYPSPQDIAGLLSEVSSDVSPTTSVPPRASEAVRRLEQAWRRGGVEERFRAAIDADAPPLALDEVPLTGTYRRFILEMRRRGVDVVLATASLAVNADSAEAHLRRHEALESRTRRLILAGRVHARFVRALSASYRARVIDTRPGLDGDDDRAFLDLFHLTDAGRITLADRIFQELLPTLEQEAGCR